VFSGLESARNDGRKLFDTKLTDVFSRPATIAVLTG
jgi:hypothetical protein